MTKDEALKMCLEYIETDAHERKYVRHAIKEALAQPEPKYLAFMDTPQRTWVGLTEQDRMEISDKLGLMDVAWLDLMESIEAKLKEKNT